MKKKLVALMCVVALTMSVPVLALGATSPSNDTPASTTTTTTSPKTGVDAGQAIGFSAAALVAAGAAGYALRKKVAE